MLESLLLPRAVISGIGWVLDDESGELVANVNDTAMTTGLATLLDLALGGLNMLYRQSV